MTVGILGGSFNPVHVGHMMLASYMSQYADLDRVWLMLSPRNPLKESSALIDDSHRLEMLRIAAASVPEVEVCDIELSMPYPSYTIDTLDLLNEKYADVRFRLIIGSDNWLIFDKWKDYKRIIDNYGVIVYPRPGFDVENCRPVDGVELIKAPTVDISSTFIRTGFASGKNMRAFLPEGVNEYILSHELWK